MSNPKVRKHAGSSLEFEIDENGQLWIFFSGAYRVFLKKRQRPAFEQWLRRTADWSEEDRERKADRRKR